MLNPYMRARRANPTASEQHRREAAGVSPNYQGDYRVARNRPANIPPEENTSVWIIGLPPDVSTHELLGAIRDTGRVWASVIQPPQQPLGTAAAKITFFEPLAARTFLGRANRLGQPGFVVRGFVTRVRADRNAVAEAPEPADHTRVVSITGPREVVTEANLLAYFSRYFIFQIDQVVPLVLGNSINVLEFHFGSYRCQAQWAWRNIREDPYFQQRGVTVRFERDPCDWYRLP
jgi:hypothetical protein